ncbi:MAG: small GTP-binding protein [Promethearchaeota archaeon CR_4]|nr:MAG: small GTP-binding protein [Candidatus Lokiarchaeota archaeon CR_4]
MASKYLFKMILTGSGGAGKTSLLRRYTTNSFTGSTKMTIGVDFAVHSVHIPEIGNITLQIWDFGGEQRFRSMLPGFCKGAAGALLVFSLIEPKSFFELEEWITIIRKNTNNIPVILVGSKKDLLDPTLPREISIDELEIFKIKYGVRDYKEISSKTGENVQDTFRKLAAFMARK